jgi:CPA1 family monovalent cation:H+ antiporter
MTDFSSGVLGLLIAAIFVALAARRLRLPYTVGLVLTGVALALTPVHTGIRLTHDLIFSLLLPPLLFEAALCIRWRDLRRDLLPVMVLSTLGVVIAAATVAAGMVAVLRWPAAPAVVFGVLIAATDPVSVIALFKDLGLGGRLLLLVEAESLLNDGVAAVFFALALTWAAAGGAVPSGASVGAAFAVSAGGGLAVGAACGLLAIGIAGRTGEHVVEMALTAVAAYGSFYLADHLHVSGVLATVAAGLVLGNLGLLRAGDSNRISAEGRAAVENLWAFAAFLANSLVFLLIGLAVADIPLQHLGPATLGIILLLVLLGRAMTVYPLCLLFSRSRWAIGMAEQHVLFWGGLRGALAMALALALPADVAGRDDILVATFAVVVFSVVVQGLTMRPLLWLVGVRKAFVGKEEEELLF